MEQRNEAESLMGKSGSLFVDDDDDDGDDGDDDDDDDDDDGGYLTADHFVPLTVGS